MRIAIFCNIHRSTIVKNKADHIGMWYRCHDTAPQIRTHRQQGTHQQSAIASAVDRNMFLRSPAITDNSFSNTDKIIETVFLFHPITVNMPFFTIFISTTDTALNIETAIIDPVNDINATERIMIRRRHSKIIASISIHQCRHLTVLYGIFPVYQIGWYHRLILGWIEDLIDLNHWICRIIFFEYRLTCIIF